MISCQKPKNIFECKTCNYICSKNSNFQTHLMTAKHKRLMNPTEKNAEPIKQHICVCGKEYKHITTLYNHRQHCDVYNKSSVVSEMSNHSLDTQSIIEVLKQNQEFKNMLLEQSKQMHESQAHAIELQRQLITAVSDGKLANNSITNNTTNNNNQKFNLNFFLNTTCKDAINMSDFIQTIEVQMNELENIGHNGYIAGMTDIILSRIKDLDVSKRPLHCTDLKREIMYIKDQNEWNKDTSEKSYLRKAIAMVAKKNYGKTIEWRECNPECLEVGSPKYDFCFKMMRNVLGDFEDIQIKMDNKIIKNLAKEVMVDR